jgi:hypothetical protein
MGGEPFDQGWPAFDKGWKPMREGLEPHRRGLQVGVIPSQGRSPGVGRVIDGVGTLMHETREAHLVARKFNTDTPGAIS